ncbi:unnamed protein product, partial [Linum tenue]
EKSTTRKPRSNCQDPNRFGEHYASASSPRHDAISYSQLTDYGGKLGRILGSTTSLVDNILGSSISLVE